MKMPETAMNKNYLFVAGQNYIGFAGQGFIMETKTKAHPVNYATNDYFGLGIFVPNLRHIERALFLGMNISVWSPAFRL